MRTDSIRPAGEVPTSPIALIVPRTLVKEIKDFLEAHEHLDKKVKISPVRTGQQNAYLKRIPVEVQADTFLVPTKLSIGIDQSDSDISRLRRDLLQSLDLVKYEELIDIADSKQLHSTHSFLGPERGCDVLPMNPLARTISHWLHQLPSGEANCHLPNDILLSYSWTYMIYLPLLLLPPSALSNLTSVFASKGRNLPQNLSSLWRLLSDKFKVSHIALNAPILASVPKDVPVEGGGRPEANILRSPTGLTPLYGDFGPAFSLTHVPNTTDFSSAFWCTSRQNGIFQTWAPRYTMFSRGNISEKARILNLKALTEKRLRSQPGETSAVDLYAGIGYFAFSYAKAGVSKVLCWEINPWSVAGLRSGAKTNGWGVNVIMDGQAINDSLVAEEPFIVFQESNEHAARRMTMIRDTIPPVRHINCGLLPSSKDSWEIAVQVLDPMGGWIHAHENIAKTDIETRKQEIVAIFTLLAEKHWGQGLKVPWEINCEHLEQVKSYAPGVVHCVLDIAISHIE